MRLAAGDFNKGSQSCMLLVSFWRLQMLVVGMTGAATGAMAATMIYKWLRGALCHVAPSRRAQAPFQSCLRGVIPRVQVNCFAAVRVAILATYCMHPLGLPNRCRHASRTLQGDLCRSDVQVAKVEVDLLQASSIAYEVAITSMIVRGPSSFSLRKRWSASDIWPGAAGAAGAATAAMMAGSS